MRRIRPKAVVIATGCRERTREMIHIPGTRPAGVFSAGFAQKLINIEGLLPGRSVVIIGSGDIGLIMARRFTLEGARVKAVIEIQPQSRGLMRNVVQCAQDFDIPMYFGHTVSRIYGRDRVEKVSVIRVDGQFKEIPGTGFEIDCDTVLVSVGLIPENELLEMAGARIDRKTNVPVAEEQGKTSLPGVFVCGNAARVYDLVDSVSCDAESCGRMAGEYVLEARGYRR
jgi:NADPH-dependent 2,4-dienoyl-CoA reductase/sulfur reductase-like enzyme